MITKTVLYHNNGYEVSSHTHAYTWSLPKFSCVDPNKLNGENHSLALVMLMSYEVWSSCLGTKKLYPHYSSCNWVPCTTKETQTVHVSSNRWTLGCCNVHQWDMVHLTCPTLSNRHNFSARFSNASLIMYVGSLWVYVCPPTSPWWIKISHHLVVVRLTVAPNCDRARVPSHWPCKLHTRVTSYTLMNTSVMHSLNDVSFNGIDMFALKTCLVRFYGHWKLHWWLKMQHHKMIQVPKENNENW